MADAIASAPPRSYCSAVRLGLPEPHRSYHDHVYGFPVAEDDALFGRLVLEIAQAGLSWTTILRKQAAFERAFAGFDIGRVAAYGEADLARLLGDVGIVRNRRKLEAVIENARRIAGLRHEHGSLTAWLAAHHPQPLEAWQNLFRRTFTFTGGTITTAFLVSTGWLPGAHDPECEVYPRVLAAGPPWAGARPAA
jgi:DNA-3-methyladenine glycosylase I